MRTAMFLSVFMVTCFYGCKEQEVTPCVTLNNPYRIEDTVVFEYCFMYDLNGVACEWDFGDGSTAKGVRVSHLYNAAGSYTITQRAYTEKKSVVINDVVTVADATAYDYEGTFGATTFCFCDSAQSCGTPVTDHQVTISALSPSSIAIHNLYQLPQSVTANVYKHHIEIPQQVVAGYVVYGFGDFNAAHNSISLSFTTVMDTGTRMCYIPLSR